MQSKWHRLAGAMAKDRESSEEKRTGWEVCAASSALFQRHSHQACFSPSRHPTLPRNPRATPGGVSQGAPSGDKSLCPRAAEQMQAVAGIRPPSWGLASKDVREAGWEQ